MENERGRVPSAWAGWISVILGIWLIVSPWALGHAAYRGPLWNNLVLGILVLIVGIVVGSSGSSGLSWWNAVFGFWLILSPFLLRYTRLEAVMVNDIVVGLLALTAGLMKPTPSRRLAVS